MLRGVSPLPFTLAFTQDSGSLELAQIRLWKGFCPYVKDICWFASVYYMLSCKREQDWGTD